MTERKFGSVNMCDLLEMFGIALGNFRFPDQLFNTPPDVIVVLSAPPTKKGEEFIEFNDENEARILYGVKEWHLCGKTPKFIISGEPQQLWTMYVIAQGGGMPITEMTYSDCGNRGVANTNTQMQALARAPWMEGVKSVLFITTDYHIPRVFLNAKQCLPGVEIRVEAVESESIGINFSQVGDEINRIIAYCEKGDLAFPE